MVDKQKVSRVALAGSLVIAVFDINWDWPYLAELQYRCFL